jgi:predicted nucleic acid-binding protein
VARALARAEVEAAGAAERILAGIHQVAINDAILATAARLRPASLRTLDAIHLATALALGADSAILVSYDRRLAEAASASGIPTASPTD